MPKHDYSSWLTKSQAAEAIGVSTKTIEKLADEKKLQQAEWKRPEGGPRIMVYHPHDVGRIRLERNPDALPFEVPATDAPPIATKALATRQPTQEQQLMRGIAAMVAASQNSEKLRPFLTIYQASEYTGLGVLYIRRMITEGRLAALKGAGAHGADVLRKADLDKL